MIKYPKPNTKHQKNRWEWGVLVLILLLAAFLRLYRLDSVPPGLTHDEADTGYFVASVYHGAPSLVKAPYGYANEPFTMYSGALLMALLGPTDLALRVHSAFFGVLMILLGYLWARIAFNAPTAIGAAALTAVSFWPIATSRFALNPQPAPALFAGAMWFLWLALFDDRPPRSRWWAWLLFALLLAGSLWAYEVARATTAAIIAFGILIALTDRARAQQRGGWFMAALAMGLVLAAPHLLDADAWRRSATLATTLSDLKTGDLRPLLTTSIEAVRTFTFQGDPFITYNVPGRPIFDPLVGILFYGGILLCLWHWRRPAYAFTLLWISTGILPSMIVGAWNSTLHSMGMQSVVFIPPALFAVEASRWLGRRYGLRATLLAGVAFAGLVGLTCVFTFRDYFMRWGEWPEVRAAYFHNLAAITDYVNRTPYSGAVALSSPFPDLPLDPFIADLRVHRSDLSLHWFDAQRALVFPDAARSLMIVPPNTPLAPELAERLDLRKLERVNLRPDDVDPYFDVFEWNPRDAFARLTSKTQIVVAGDRSLGLPVNFSAVELVAYESPAQIKPGETISLLTVWRILDPAALGPTPAHDYGHSVAIFAQLLDTAHTVVAQEDRLDAPAWNWHAGEAFAQLHRVTVKPDTPPGVYTLQVGMYRRDTIKRLAVYDSDKVVDDHVILGSVRVAIGQ